MAKTTKNGIEDRLSWLGPLALGVLILVIYGSFVRAPFAYDDRIHILENPQVLAFGSSGAAGAIRGLVENPFGLAGRPLLFLTYGLNYATSGADPAVFRLTNFVIHAANSILVFFIALELALLRKQDSVRFALLAAGLFAAHPLLTESVTYIAGRSSSLCATFYFAGLYFALRAGRSESRVRTMLLSLVLVCAALGWLVKQDAIVLPAAAVAMIWLAWPQHVPARQRRLATAACVAVLAVIFVFQSRSMGAVSTTTQENARLVAAGFEETAPLYAYFATSIREFSAYYLWRLFVPLKLSVDPQVTVADGLISPSVLLSALLLAFAAAAAFHYRKRLPLISAGVALTLISPLSAYCLFPLADVVAEHRAYITALGGVIVFAAGILRLPRASLIGVTVLVAYGWLTVERNKVWSDEILLWRDAATQAPGKLRPHVNLGALFQTRGQLAEAMREYDLVLQIEPGHDSALANLASLYMAGNDLSKAEELLQRAIAAETKFAAAYLNLAVVRIRQARFAEARELLLRAGTLNPSQLLVHHNLGDTLFNENRPDQAIGEYVAELRLNPGSIITHFHLAKAYEATAAREKSLEHYRVVERADPANAEVQAAIRRLR